MPDFERIMDEIRENAALGPVNKAFEKGYTAGKRHARIEIAVVLTLISAGVIPLLVGIIYEVCK